jgi:predicted Zn-dependent protease
MRMKRWLAALAAAVLVGSSPATAQALSERDKAQGAQVRPQIIREFGGEVKGPLADYVERIGLKVALAAVPGSRPSDWSVTVLNSPIPNAMATPGGYLYITRGLLALMNDEAELASVLGHEAGHVVARHSAKSQTRATLAGIGAMAATILTGSDLVGAGAQLLGAGVLGQYSQKQEYQADTLGLQYMTRLGYDPFATGSMLAALGRAEVVARGTQSEERRQSSWFATHPLTEARVARANQIAASKKVAPGLVVRNRDPFLAAIDGMAWGDAPDQGIVSGNRFAHAKMGFAFEAPPGWQLVNSPSAVRGRGPDGSQFAFSGARIPEGRSVDDIARATWQQLAGGVPNGIQANRPQVNGFDTLDTRARLGTRQGTADVGVSVIRWDRDSAFLFVTQAPAGRTEAMDTLLRSFRLLTPAEAARVGRGLKLDVVTVKPGDTAESLARQMAFPDNQLMRFLALNGMQSRPLKPGEKLKIIVDA